MLEGEDYYCVDVVFPCLAVIIDFATSFELSKDCCTEQGLRKSI